jgi:CTP synthase
VKYVLVSGGVMSGIGKGVVASSIGMLLKAAGLSVTSIKIDAYINFDAGTMSPFEHGEVFVLSDGGEADLDLGNYERFLDVTLSSDNNITTGKIYQRVIDKERKGLYLGKTVQVVPHVVDEIQAWIERVAARPVRDGVVHAADASASASTRVPDVCIIELGGTVGDIELMPFVEALRQFAWRVGRANFVDVHVSLVPLSSGEQKSKPTQTTVAQLRQLGLQPDFIFCRCSEPLAAATKAKIAMFCQVRRNDVCAFCRVCVRGDVMIGNRVFRTAHA